MGGDVDIGRLWKQARGPFTSIAEQPFDFISWFVIAVIIGLAGSWLPLVLYWSEEKLTSAVFFSLVRAGGPASFSVVLLAEGISSAFAALRAGTNAHTAGLRRLAFGIALIVLLVQVGFLGIQTAAADVTVRSAVFQLCITSVAVLWATYLYCFRFASWEKGVREVLKKEERDVEKLKKLAAKESKDDEGVKL
jgi:hypothetical protein